MDTHDQPSDALRLGCGDCLELMAGLPDSSVHLIVADPPYFKVKNLPWDRQWDTAAGFLEWIGQLGEQWQRILKPNGSLYVFASPRMAARVEVEVGKWFNVLNSIVWNKGDGSGAEKGARGGLTRSYINQTERIIFAEHFGADNIAKGEAGYAAKCDELRGFVFEPIRSYLDGEREAVGLTPEQVNVLCGYREQGGMAGRHYFSRSQFHPPTALAYAKLQTTGRFQRPYEDLRREYEDLRREYEDLRREYEDLRRPFAVSADVPYTDVWDFPTVKPYPGKHPCEKPYDLIAHIITASSRPGDVVLDPCCGSGVTGEATVRLGRRFIGFDQDPAWVERTRRRIEAVGGPVTLPVPAPQPAPDRPVEDDDLLLFRAARAV